MGRGGMGCGDVDMCVLLFVVVCVDVCVCVCVCVYVSVCGLQATSATVDRYFVVCHPYHRRSQ